MTATTIQATHSAAEAPAGIPMPIVTLNRWLLFGGVLLAFIAQQPLVTTVLLGIALPGTLFGPRYSPVAAIGKRLFAARNRTAEREAPELQRFNNTIAVALLALAQAAFLAGFPIVGWALSFMVATAAAVALAGFCFGCYLYFQLKRVRYRMKGRG